MWQVGDNVLYDFLVEKQLGQGGMGTVWLFKSQSSGERFAVKTIREKLLGDVRTRFSFLKELHAWIDLPLNPYITACNFFRTIDDKMTIFAEYIEGGSLKTWIRNSQITPLEKILDIAIQTAWGLHASHESGLIHQDVKPGNMLVTKDGQAKITDFGLARAKGQLKAERFLALKREESFQISSSGMTPAYCSPEQINQEQISRKTDLWSWAVSVLEMFIGKISWSMGAMAGYTLREYLDGNVEVVPGMPSMPDDVADLLRQCFQMDPVKRQRDMMEIADGLQDIHRMILRNDYPRDKPEFSKAKQQLITHRDRIDIMGSNWDNPKIWIEKALIAANRDASEAEELIIQSACTRSGRLVAEIAGFDSAWQVYRSLPAKVLNNLAIEWNELCSYIFKLHATAGNFPGALFF